MMKEQLIKAANEGRNHAYAPYSNFLVGAAVLAENGQIYQGCNVENASYGLCNCAERTAIFKAISEGNRKINAMAIVADTAGAVAPCGACRQVMSEFCDQDTKFYLTNLHGAVEEWTMDQLLPGAFSSSDMDKVNK